MWIRKSLKRIQIESEFQKYSLTQPLLGFVFSMLLLYVMFFSKGRRGIYFPAFVNNPNEYSFYISIIIGISSLVFIIISWIRIRKKVDIFENKFQIKFTFCTDCHKTKMFNGDYYCECGGKLFDFNEMEWMDEKTEELYMNNRKKYEELRIAEIKRPVLYKILKRFFPKAIAGDL